MAGWVCSIGAEGPEQPVDIRLVAGDERPARFCSKFLGKTLKPLRHIGGRINCNRYQLNTGARGVTELLLDAAHSRCQWRADRGAGSENEIDRDGPTFHQIGI